MNTILTRPNASSGIPIYLQLVEQVTDAIEAGALRPGDCLPDVRPLATSLVIHPSAVRQAYQELENHGIIAGRKVEPFGRLMIPDLTANTGSADRFRPADWQRELARAREVQERLWPQDQPQLAGLDCAGASVPALGVGGDYYDFISVSSHELVIALGDVSGKGIPAALLMATLRASLRTLMMAPNADLAQVIANLNQLVYESSTANRFASLFAARYDATSRTLAYVNAGHNPPLLVRSRADGPKVIRLDPTGPVVGLLPECPVEEKRIVLESGDTLVAFSDGVPDAVNAGDEEWGDERLMRTVVERRDHCSGDLVQAILSRISEFVGAAPQHDDITLVAARIS